jgi:D-sedoheptulose 7-phosphate isomerase
MKAKSYNYINELIDRYPKLSSVRNEILSAISILMDTTKNGGTYLICGNGGSAADSDHIVGELMKGFILKRRVTAVFSKKIQDYFPDDFDYLVNNLQQGIRSISLMSHNALVSAFSNDKASDLIFAQQVYGYGKPGDTLFAISTSGNSKNVLHAAQVARVLGLKVISLTGASGGKLRELSDVLINVPETETYKIQEFHLPIYHCICLILENELFGE